MRKRGFHDNEQYYDCIQPYQNACQIMRAKLEVLNGSLYQKSAVSPIHNIQERIKSKRSIEKAGEAGTFGQCAERQGSSPGYRRNPCDLLLY